MISVLIFSHLSMAVKLISDFPMGTYNFFSNDPLSDSSVSSPLIAKKIISLSSCTPPRQSKNFRV